MNIKNTLEVVALGASLGKAFNSANSDGSVNAADLGLLIGIVPHVAPAIKDISEVPKELKDLDENEIKLITEKVVEIVGDVGSEKAARIARSSLKLGLNAYELVTEIRTDDAA